MSVSVAASSASARTDAGGTLTVAGIVPVLNTQPYPLSTPNATWRLAVFNTLVQVDKNLRPLPELATSWKVDPSYKTFIFTLRKDVKFTNGLPFTAKIAAWNIKYAAAASTGAQVGVHLASAVVSTLGKYTLKLQFPTATPQVFSALTDVPIIRPAGDIATNAIGTGPFKIESLQPGQEMVLTKNPNYWEKGYPKFDKLVVKSIPDPSTMVLNLQRGTVDLLTYFNGSGIPLSQVEPLVKQGFKAAQMPSSGNADILMNASAPELKDKRVRQALSLAFDRSRFVQIALDGFATPTCVAFPPTSPVWSKAQESGCTFNLARAKTLLSQAGRSDLKVTLQVPAGSYWARFAPLYQQDLAKIGVTMQIETLDNTRWINTIVGAQFPSLIAHSYAYGTLDPAILMTAFPFRQDNPERFRSNQYGLLVANAGQTTASAARIAAYRKVGQFIRDQSFMFPVAFSKSVYMMNTRVSGFAVTQNAIPNFRRVTLK